jgi:hypothetical protein
MKQRINELAIQAGGIWRGGYVDQPNGDSVWTDRKFVVDVDTEQFARLLVKECCDVVDYDNARAITNHLGVEL